MTDRAVPRTLAQQEKVLRVMHEELSSKHAELYFREGHTGSAHCDCDLAKESRELIHQADAIRAKRKSMITCPTCKGSGKVLP